MLCSVGVSPKQSVAWASRPSSAWLGQSCPSDLHGLEARATKSVA
ncbi:MAG: hypothetical protein NZ556_02840 [Fimbriimonadales bacterium]|nr:hypothetical protein [Fimbriimonadales bacterium]